MTGGSVEGLPTGTVTFLFTDIEGSTPLWDAHPAGMRDALARHDEIMRKAIDTAGGQVFATGGDGFGVAFERAGNAVAAAMRAQRSLNMEPWPEHVTLRVRMGVHTGEVDERDGNYFGQAVNRAARLMGAAHGGQVVMSALTAELLDDSVGLELVDLGSVQLKGVVDPVHVFGATAPGVPWIDRELVSTQVSAGNLPRPRTELVGDLADLQRRVSTLGQARLVTLTGSGGVGKTRAAIEIGWLVLDEFPDGVWLIELAPIADPNAVIAAVASTLRVRPQPDVSALDSIVAWCHGRRMLLIVDNCEHVLEPVMALVSAITRDGATVTIVATSREPLGVDGERVIRIPSLEPNYGVELFCLRADAADSSFVPSTADEATIATICDRLDGIPLAIELAAARIRSLSPTELLDRLDDRFRLLRGSGRGGLERHQTLRATVTWSYQLLSPTHQLLFDRLSVFAGGFTLDAAEVVCTDDEIDAGEVIDLIGELVDKSIVVSERTESTTRYRLLETLRQFGEERLDDRGETAAVRDRHLAHYRNVAYGIDERWWSPAQVETEAVCDREWDNFRGAHQWAIATGAFQQAVDILNGPSAYYVSRIRFEAADWTSRTLELGERQHLADPFLWVATAFWTLLSGDPDRAAELAERGLAISADEKATAIGHLSVVSATMASGKFDEAVAAIPELRASLSTFRLPSNRFFLTGLIIDVLMNAHCDVEKDIEDFRALAQRVGAPYPLALVQVHDGYSRLGLEPPDVDGAISAFVDGIALASACHNDMAELTARSALAVALVIGTRNDDATPALRAVLDQAMGARFIPTIVEVVESCAVHFSNLDQNTAAATILGFIESYPAGSFISVNFRSRIRAAVTTLDDLDSLLAIGAAMSTNEVAAYALAQLDRG